MSPFRNKNARKNMNLSTPGTRTVSKLRAIDALINQPISSKLRPRFASDFFLDLIL